MCRRITWFFVKYHISTKKFESMKLNLIPIYYDRNVTKKKGIQTCKCVPQKKTQLHLDFKVGYIRAIQ